jgi:uncharacterized protein YndB with AHSA1/START domain
MPITNVTKDPENLTMTVVADFPVPLRRLWDAYSDPRQLERFWGPPTFPATFTRHDVFPGGRSNYLMTGPDGSSHGGYWEWIDVKAPEGDLASFEVKDGFTNDDGSPNTDMPDMRMVFHFESTDAGSRVTTTTHFNSPEQLAQLLEMGMEDGMKEAMGQIDDVLADLTSFAHGVGTKTDILSDTQARVSRVIRGSVEQVWRAHHEPELMRQWMLGPDGWVMTECELAPEVGGSYRTAWTRENGEDGFALVGTLDASEPPHREVTTERMFGEDGPSTVNEMTLTPVESGTLLSIVMTFPDADTRDKILETGMADGMETSYARLESVLT